MSLKPNKFIKTIRTGAITAGLLCSTTGTFACGGLSVNLRSILIPSSVSINSQPLLTVSGTKRTPNACIGVNVSPNNAGASSTAGAISVRDALQCKEAAATPGDGVKNDESAK